MGTHTSPSALEAQLRFGVAEEFQLTGEDFAADHATERWKYTGPLDDLVEWFREEFPQTEAKPFPSVGHCSIITEQHELRPDGKRVTILEVYTLASSEEEAWRLHLGEALVSDSEPYSALAEDGQTLSELKLILEDFDGSMSPSMPPGNASEAALHQRWIEEVTSEREVLGFRDWVRAVSNRQDPPLGSESTVVEDIFDSLVSKPKGTSPAANNAPPKIPGGGFQTTWRREDFTIQQQGIPETDQRSARPAPHSSGDSDLQDTIDLWSNHE